jgi:probable F420-dependent oxidoreductase
MARPFRFGVLSGGAVSAAEWTQFARAAEDLGYATLLMPDRPALGQFAPVAALTAAAMATTTLRVGSYVFCNDYRHPALLARELATLDILSRGRVEIGLGAGVSAEDYHQLGMPFADAGTRVGRLEEAVRVMKRCFTEDQVEFAGQYYTITGLRGAPKPIQRPHPPIFIGSGGKRMLTFAAREADCIAPTVRPAAYGGGADEPSLEDKIAWMREAAGARFDQIEFCQTEYGIAIADSPDPVNDQAGGPLIPKTPMSVTEACDYLVARRERYGFSYIQIYYAQMANFAPVVARLAGT